MVARVKVEMKTGLEIRSQNESRGEIDNLVALYSIESIESIPVDLVLFIIQKVAEWTWIKQRT